MMYNKVAKKCNLPFSAAFCNTVDCSNSNGDLRLMYSNSRQFWTQCITTVPGTPPTIIAGACADGFEVDFTPKNTLPPACIYRCRGSGYFPYSQDVKKYIQCYFSGWALKSIILNCEADWEFEQSAWGPWFSGCKPKKA